MFQSSSICIRTRILLKVRIGNSTLNFILWAIAPEALRQPNSLWASLCFQTSSSMYYTTFQLSKNQQQICMKFIQDVGLPLLQSIQVQTDHKIETKLNYGVQFLQVKENGSLNTQVRIVLNFWCFIFHFSSKPVSQRLTRMHKNIFKSVQHQWWGRNCPGSDLSYWPGKYWKVLILSNISPSF